MGQRVSTPSAANWSPSNTPPGPGASGRVCPHCHRRFVEGAVPPSGRCPHDGGFLVAAQANGEPLDPMIGRTLGGRFTILARVGAGSMGSVYRARQLPVGREVAIKILRSDRAVDEAARARFLREARAHSLLASPHTVTVFDFGSSDDGDFFLAMELLEGESLGHRLRRLGRLPVEMAVETARQALRSLAEAHAKGVIHRDLKPDNLFYARAPDAGARQEEIVKVLDFGIAKMVRGDGPAPMNVVETQAGTVFGTPRYMSPEQAQAKALDARSDLYSLGVILYHMLTGRPPFTDDDAILVMARHIKSPPKRLTEVWPEAVQWPELEAAVLRALAKDPSQRPGSAEAMASELQQAFENDVAASSGVRHTSVSSKRRISSPRLSRSDGNPVLSTLDTPGGVTTDTLDEQVHRVAAEVKRRRRVVFGTFVGTVLLGGLVAWFFARPQPPPEDAKTAHAAGLVSPAPAPSPTSDRAAPALLASAKLTGATPSAESTNGGRNGSAPAPGSNLPASNPHSSTQPAANSLASSPSNSQPNAPSVSSPREPSGETRTKAATRAPRTRTAAPAPPTKAAARPSATAQSSGYGLFE